VSGISLAAFMERSLADGPGTRAVVWVQGCSLNCPGCANPEMQPFIDKKLVSAKMLAERILAVPDIDGVTFSGGEPFSQARGLAEVARRISKIGLNVVTYSGHMLEGLSRADRPDWDELLEATDLLIDGPFVRELTGRHLWRGSSNQRLNYLSGRIRPEEKNNHVRPRVHVAILGDGRVQVSGFPDEEFNMALERTLGQSR